MTNGGEGYGIVNYEESEIVNCKFDKYDLLFAAFAGISAGVVDALFVGMPKKSVLGKVSDKVADNLVKKIAHLAGWNPRQGNENKIASAIGFLERRYQVNYDQRYGAEVGNQFRMTTKNHHYKSLAHSPDIVGLFFSILNQFTHTSTFIDNGQLKVVKTSNEIELQGKSFISKLFCGMCNWFFHLVSDVAGSSGIRGKADAKRGSGIPAPFMELFLLCDFGAFGKDRQTLAVVMTQVFEQGYDMRFATATAIPVILQDLMIRIFWVIKRRYYFKTDWKYLVPNDKKEDLRLMLIVGNGALCIVDGVDALLRGGGNAIVTILRMNYVAWVRMVILIFKELKIRFGSHLAATLKHFLEMAVSGLAEGERKKILEYYQQLEYVKSTSQEQYEKFLIMLNEEYEAMYQNVRSITLANLQEERTQAGVLIAQKSGVPQKDVLHNINDVDKVFWRK